MKLAINDREVKISRPDVADRHPVEWLTLLYLALSGVLSAGVLWKVVV